MKKTWFFMKNTWWFTISKNLDFFRFWHLFFSILQIIGTYSEFYIVQCERNICNIYIGLHKYFYIIISRLCYRFIERVNFLAFSEDKHRNDSGCVLMDALTKINANEEEARGMQLRRGCSSLIKLSRLFRISRFFVYILFVTLFADWKCKLPILLSIVLSMKILRVLYVTICYWDCCITSTDNDIRLLAEL